MKKILITGANSYIGTSFERYINKKFKSEYQIDTVDMTDLKWQENDFSGYNAVFHVAGIAHRKETKENSSLYYEVNFDLAVKTAQKAKKDGVRQFVFLSSMSVYGMNSGVINKAAKLAPKNSYGKSKLMAEKEILKLEDESFCVTVIRPPMVYGAGCRGNFNSLVKIANKLPMFPEIANRRSMIYIDNLSEFVERVIDAGLGGIYTPQNSEYMNTTDMARWILEAQGKKCKASKILGLGVKMLVPFVSAAEKAFGSLVYDVELETFDFEYCVVHAEESVKKSVISEENACER